MVVITSVLWRSYTTWYCNSKHPTPQCGDIETFPYLLRHVMSGGTVHVVITPSEEVVLHDVQVLTWVRELKLGLCQACRLSRAQER